MFRVMASLVSAAICLSIPMTPAFIQPFTQRVAWKRRDPPL